ncbi:type IVB secretion system protein IcmH/DotU [Ningiella sp. W23]|uniref:type IVB secretion system protein IcmH/DotU n=1 Tax=Ningiella sp. W23 TaxID=3023715 RepID=UPI003757E3BC
MTDKDDDLSKTMVIPNPGGRLNRRQQTTLAVTSQSVLDATQSAPFVSEPLNIRLENKVLAHATELINLASNILTLEPNNSVDQLRNDIEQHIEKFDKRLISEGVSQEVALTGRYLLCCLLDELVLSTPWGIESIWSRQTLLSKYHNETSGGEKFFVIINKLMEQAQQSIDLIELCYLCLSIGFRGKYRLSPTGENEILQICNMMYQAISLYRPCANDLSPSWKTDLSASTSIQKRVPPSLLFLVLTFICIATYVALLSNLHAQSSPLYEKIESIGWNKSAYEREVSHARDSDQSSTANVLRDVRQKMRQSIASGLLEVEQQNNLLTLRFASEQLFPPGSTQVNEAYLPNKTLLIETIRSYSDSILIVGHTDSTGRAESNWVISRQRAESIEKWLLLDANHFLQMTTRGLADTQPLTPTPSDSRNRRVEILVLLTGDV